MAIDNRDPEDVYRAILEQKTAWNCSIVEAAERVEAERRAQAFALTTNGDRPVPLSPGHPAAQWPVQ
jgi:hypothetical protein